jgi:hypothetical protein
MVETGFRVIETLIYTSMVQIVGDPMILGLLILGFFGAFVMLQGTRLDGKMVILFPASILAVVYIGPLVVIIALVVGIMMYLAWMKITGK